MITGGMTPDVSASGQVPQTDRPTSTYSSQESRQSHSQSVGRFVLESDHLALKNNSECVTLLCHFVSVWLCILVIHKNKCPSKF